MKKLISLALALVFVLSMATVAFATAPDATSDPVQIGGQVTGDATVEGNTIVIKKNYTATGTTAVSPAETFTFKITSGNVENGGVGSNGQVITNSPTASIDNVTYTEGEAGTTTATKNITVTLPAYEAVGVYHYTITEDKPSSKTPAEADTAGVTYFAGTINLVITVVQGEDGKLVYGAVHCESSATPYGQNKTDTFTNDYAAGTLAVSKTVSGNLGDQGKDFAFTVEFSAPTGIAVRANITTANGSAETVTVTPNDWTNGTASKTFNLKHGETVTFTNIPYGVSYKVTETATNDYVEYVTHNNGNKAEGTEASGTINASLTAATVAFENVKTADVDTGITLDTLPFVLILAVCAGAVVLFVVKRRRSTEF